MITIVAIMFVLLFALYVWVDKKRLEAFPDEFSLTRIFKNGNKGSDPQKSVSRKKSLGITSKSKGEAQFTVKR